MSEKVVVTSSNGPHLFYIYREQFLIHEAEFLDILNEIGKHSTITKKESVRIDNVYLVRSPLSKSQWMRVKVLRESVKTKDSWITLLLDYGNTVAIQWNYLMTTQMDFILDYEPRAQRCQLVNFEEEQCLEVNKLFDFQVPNR